MKFTFGYSSIFLVTSVSISTVAFTKGHDEAVEFWAKFEALAREAMTLRQNDLPMSEAMQKLGSKEAGVVMVKDAYASPFFTLQSLKESQIRNFSNTVFSSCYEALTDM
ncbi:hypothetical protein SKP08_000951 [Vibrio fluvialis]|nr:hypothetical protein [Vibrio fluvialis]